MTVPALSPPRGLETRELATVAAVAISGAAAAWYVSPVFYATTFAVVGLVVRDARRSPVRQVSQPSEFAEFPQSTRDAIGGALSALANGEPRRLLLSVVVQARPVFAAHEPLLDASAERTTRDNAASLVQACCAVALELSRFDEVSAASASPGRRPGVDAASTADARAGLVDMLTRASNAFNSLYLAGLDHGSPASGRVAELVSEIETDARARAAARSELGGLL